MAAPSMPKRSPGPSTALEREIVFQKLGQPVPESNLVFESKSAVSQQMQHKGPNRILVVLCPRRALVPIAA
jgi:hypothetical protein